MPLQFCSLRGAVALASVFFAGCIAQRGIIHRVEEGQSIPEIAHLYDVEIQAILAANPAIDSGVLHLGDKLLIPGSSISPRKKGEETIETVTATPEPISNTTVIQSGKAAPTKTAHSKPLPPKRLVPRPVVGKLESVKLSLQWPAHGRVISAFGKKRGKMHNGIDIEVKGGTPIVCALDGEVAYRGSSVPGYGDLVIVWHSGNFFTVYAYLGRITVNKGDKIRAGEPLAYVLSQGSKAFFHFELRQGKVALNPENFLK